MELYSLNEADKLIKFYSDKMVNKQLEKSTQSLVDFLQKEQYGENKYRVVAVGKMMPGNIIPKRSIDKVAKDLDLPLPKDVIGNPD